MAIAYLLIKTLPGQEKEVCNKLSYIPEVYDTSQLTGEYSLIVKIVAGNYESLGRITMDNIRTIDGIIALEILPVADSPDMIQVIEEPIRNTI